MLRVANQAQPSDRLFAIGACFALAVAHHQRRKLVEPDPEIVGVEECCQPTSVRERVRWKVRPAGHATGRKGAHRLKVDQLNLSYLSPSPSLWLSQSCCTVSATLGLCTLAGCLCCLCLSACLSLSLSVCSVLCPLSHDLTLSDSLIYLCLPLCISVTLCLGVFVPLCASLCVCLSACPSLCQSLPLSASLCQSPSVCVHLCVSLLCFGFASCCLPVSALLGSVCSGSSMWSVCSGCLCLICLCVCL